MLTEYTTPGASVEVRDDESIYSLLTERIKRTGEDTVIAERKTAPGQWTKVTTGEFHKNVLSAAKGLMCRSMTPIPRRRPNAFSTIPT